MKHWSTKLRNVLSVSSVIRASMLCACCGAAHAADPVGFVKTVQGTVSVTTAGSPTAALVGTAVFLGSQIRTAPAASVGVTFKDNTVIALGPDTDMTVDEYVFNPSQGQVKFGSKLARGTLNYVSGTIAKLNPESVQMRTPAGIIGVRGTQFVTKVEAEQ